MMTGPATDVWQYREDIASLARYLCRHPEDAEDVAHSALLKAAAALDGFRGESTVRTWLHRIAANECRMLRRRTPPHPLESLADTAGLDVDPEELVVELETRREVLAALETLPDRYRCVLLLREGEGLSMDELAAALDTTVPSVKSLLFRARAALRSRLEADGRRPGGAEVGDGPSGVRRLTGAPVPGGTAQATRRSTSIAPKRTVR